MEMTISMSSTTLGNIIRLRVSLTIGRSSAVFASNRTIVGALTLTSAARRSHGPTEIPSNTKTTNGSLPSGALANSQSNCST